MVEYLSSSSTSVGTNGGLSNRTYYWGPLDLPRNEWNFIQTREEGRMISGGTTGLFCFPPSSLNFQNLGDSRPTLNPFGF